MRMERLPAALLACLALLTAGATALLPARVEEVARQVESVRGRRFERQIPASEIDPVELKKVLRAKLLEGFPASPEDTMRTMVAIGFFEETPNLVDRLLDFYASQVIAFYDPEPRKFFLVKGGAAGIPAPEELSSDAGERMIFAHELTHALQDEFMKLDRRVKQLKDNGDRALALESLLEGEATLVMVRVALSQLPGGQSSEVEDSLAPLLSAGTLESANMPKDLPDYFAQQLFFPYVEGTAYVRRVVKAGGWAGIDRMWKNPPATTSEILHEGPAFTPAEDLLTAPAADRLAPAGFRTLYTDTIGEWGVRFLLRRGLAAAQADPLAAGWRGDRIAFYAAGRDIAYVWKLRFESPGAAERFASAWTAAAKLGGAVTRRGPDLTILKTGGRSRETGKREMGNEGHQRQRSQTGN
ncbi:MAG: hypothetical protein LC796_12840 [Acidobacteria bacterium]|nr:hypothetical protein [Acidobacteriota bacterium]MCA1611572.1 hypothetical protein [Acidobacteriota bacterium]